MTEYIKREVLSKIMNDIAGDETCPMNIAADIYYAVDCIATWYNPVKPNELRCEINSTRNHDVKLMLALRCIELMTGEEGFERRNLNE